MKKRKRHSDPLHITVDAKGMRILMVLIYDGSALNVCPLKTASCLGSSIEDFMPSNQHVRAYDSNRREVLGTMTLSLAYRILQSPIALTKMNWSLLNYFPSPKIPPH